MGATSDAVAERRGSFGRDIDLAFPLSAHYADRVTRGDLVGTTVDARVAWTTA